LAQPNGKPPLIAHVVHTLRVGGMENGLVNLINRTPAGRYRHAVICLTDYDRFAERIEVPEVPIHALHKREGKDPAVYGRLWRLLRQIRPDLVHTRNLAALEGQLPAALAGVRRRVHGEHGRDMADLTGSSRKYRWLRRAYRPLIHAFVPLSADLERYLREGVGVPANRITRICNGVDVARFHPEEGARARFREERGWQPETLVIGWVGRMEPVKNPLGLVDAFARLVARHPEWRNRLGLALVGGGSQSPQVAAALAEAGLADRAWLPGSREDVPELLRAFDVFALPSLAEGISNTILESLASGVPVVATDVGGNAELVAPAMAGRLVPAKDPEALATALGAYLGAPERLAAERDAARARAVERFSIDTMVGAYLDLYDRVLHGGREGAVTTQGVSG
jgi:sugar transferase (PEP-CTERM/EpsH1 system associated)